MSISRRGFLGAAGLSALALASKPALEALGFEAVPQEPTSATVGTRGMENTSPSPTSPARAMARGPKPET